MFELCKSVSVQVNEELLLQHGSEDYLAIRFLSFYGLVLVSIFFGITGNGLWHNSIPLFAAFGSDGEVFLDFRFNLNLLYLPFNFQTASRNLILLLESGLVQLSSEALQTKQRLLCIKWIEWFWEVRAF